MLSKIREQISRAVDKWMDEPETLKKVENALQLHRVLYHDEALDSLELVKVDCVNRKYLVTMKIVTDHGVYYKNLHVNRKGEFI